MAEKRYPSLKGAMTRMKQEMAKLEAMKVDALAELGKAPAAAAKKAKRAREVMQELEPTVRRWVDNYMPEEDQVGKQAGILYVAAALELRDALGGSALSEQLVEKFKPTRL